MLGKTKTGSGFKGTVEYCLQEKKNAEILHSNNIAHTDKKGIIKEFVSLSSTNDGISKPVWHSSLSFSNADNITDDRMAEIANRFMEKAGFDMDNNQWTIIKHNDTKHQHCHIVANRVGFDGKTIDDYYFKSRTVQWAKEIEEEFKLTKVQEIAQKARLEVKPDLEKEKIKEAVIKTLKQPHIKSIQAFQNDLKNQGIEMKVLSHINTGKAYGVVFSMGNKVYKGSEIGKQLAFKALNKIIPLDIPIPGLNVIKIAAKIISKGIQLGI